MSGAGTAPGSQDIAPSKSDGPASSRGGREGCVCACECVCLCAEGGLRRGRVGGARGTYPFNPMYFCVVCFFYSGIIFVMIKCIFKKGSPLGNRIAYFRASLVAQWLRICLPVQRTRVRALVWEDPTCRGAARPVSHSY